MALKRREQGLRHVVPATPIEYCAAWSNSPGAFCCLTEGERAGTVLGIAPAPPIARFVETRKTMVVALARKLLHCALALLSLTGETLMKASFFPASVFFFFFLKNCRLN